MADEEHPELDPNRGRYADMPGYRNDGEVDRDGTALVSGSAIGDGDYGGTGDGHGWYTAGNGKGEEDGTGQETLSFWGIETHAFDHGDAAAVGQEDGTGYGMGDALGDGIDNGCGTDH